MGNVGQNAEYIQPDQHSYLNQHNSGDEWLTGFAGDAMRSIYGSYYGRISALNVWFMATRIIFVHVPSTIQCTLYSAPGRPTTTTYSPPRRASIPENYFELGKPSEKNSSTGVRASWPWLMPFWLSIGNCKENLFNRSLSGGFPLKLT